MSRQNAWTSRTSDYSVSTSAPSSRGHAPLRCTRGAEDRRRAVSTKPCLYDGGDNDNNTTTKIITVSLWRGARNVFSVDGGQCRALRTERTAKPNLKERLAGTRSSAETVNRTRRDVVSSSSADERRARVYRRRLAADPPACGIIRRYIWPHPKPFYRLWR